VLGRDRATRRTAFALGLASTGLVLVLAGAGSGALDGIGVALGLTAAIVYSTYILVSDGVAGRVPALALSTLVCTGAATTLTLGGLAVGDLQPGAVSPAGMGWLAGIALVSTVGALGLFFAGLRLIGPSTAAILSTLEPVVTVVLAAAVFGESLGLVPLAGGALVLAAVVALRAPAARAVSLAAPEAVRA
jgi:drug/metabolite transporter (DMT)-like permease